MMKLQPCEIALAAETESNGCIKQPIRLISKIDIRIQNLINNRILTSVISPLHCQVQRELIKFLCMNLNLKARRLEAS